MTMISVGVGRARRDSGLTAEQSVRRYSWQFYLIRLVFDAMATGTLTTHPTEEMPDEQDEDFA